MKININGVDHSLTKDDFDIAYIDGARYDEWVDQCSLEDKKFLMTKAMELSASVFDDINERLEQPYRRINHDDF